MFKYILQVETNMIHSWKHKGLEHFFTKGSTKGIQPKHFDKLSEILTVLHAADNLKDLNKISYKLHKLRGNKKGFYAIQVDADWRITFMFAKTAKGASVTLINYEDYH